MSPAFALDTAKQQNVRRGLHYICTQDDLDEISESFVVYISRRTNAIGIKGRERETNDRLEPLQRAAALSTLENSGCLTMCVNSS